MVTSLALWLLLPWALKFLIDAVNGDPLLNFPRVMMIFVVIMIMLFSRDLLWRAHGIINYKYFEADVMADIYRDIMRKLKMHSYEFFSNNFAGSLVKQVNFFVGSFARLWALYRFNFLGLFLGFIGTSITFFIFSPALAAGYCVWLIVFLVFNYYTTRWKLKSDMKRTLAKSKTSGTVSDIIGNIVTVKFFAKEAQEDVFFDARVQELKEHEKESQRRFNIIALMQAGILYSLFGLVMYFVILKWREGSITPGDFVLIWTYLYQVVDNIWYIGVAFRDTFEALVDSRELTETLNAEYDVRDAENAQDVVIQDGEIIFDNVVFKYHEKAVIDGFSLSIAAGEKVAFVGSSGAGKSTITKLLLRLYDIESGVIAIDGMSIKDMTLKSLREQISFVPQEPVLFHRTLRENIAYAKPEATEEEIIEAARKARCYDFIMQTPEGFDTYVGERGIKLSGGERQRVAIARALLKDAPILILDEATSSLDSESEKLIQEALGELMKGKTTIVIAHRLSTIMNMDRIIVIEGGRVVDQGTHADLEKKKGIYAKLWSIQQGGYLE
jgi:ATP-binding cassette subfamily B protein